MTQTTPWATCMRTESITHAPRLRRYTTIGIGISANLDVEIDPNAAWKMFDFDELSTLQQRGRSLMVSKCYEVTQDTAGDQNGATSSRLIK